MNFKNLLFFAVSILFVACGGSDSQPDNNQSTSEVMEEPESNLAGADVASVSMADTVFLPSGLIYIITQKGNGAVPVPGKKVKVHYTGTLVDGTVFDSSRKKSEPLEFNIGRGEVIRGWDEGIALLQEGSRATLIIPYQLAYGEQGYPGVIPPRATLVFDVELIWAEK